MRVGTEKTEYWAFSAVVRIGTPHPSQAGECVHPLWFRGGGRNRLRERGWGWGGPNSDEGKDTTLVYMNFVRVGI